MSTVAGTEAITLDCLRCAGNGRIAMYSNVSSGICYDCNGSAIRVTTPAKEAARLAHLAKAPERRAARVATYVTKQIRAAKADGLDFDAYHATICYCGKPGGCRPGAVAEFDAI